MMKPARRKTANRLLVASVCIPALLISGNQGASAQTEGEPAADEVARMGTIIVSARKRDERLIDVPETITAFSEDSLNKAGIVNIDKLGQVLPNVVLARRGDNEPNVVIRGIGSFGNVQGIGFYVDDVQNFTDQASRLVDLERVEVLKGPQGTLYGGSSIGGAVKYVTRRPSDEFQARASVEAGGQGILNFNGSVNIPFSDQFAARFSGYVDNNDGFLRNNFRGDYNDEAEEYGFRAAFGFSPSPATDINLGLRYSHLENGGNDYYLTSSPRDYRLSSDLDAETYNRRRVAGGILSIEQDLGGISLTSLSSYTERENRLRWDLDYTPLDNLVAQQRVPVVTKVVTQELRLQSDNDSGWSWLAGGYYSSVRDRSLLTTADLHIGVDLIGTTNVIENFHNNTSLEQTLAAFATVGYEAGPFEASLGARVNRSDFKGVNRWVPDSQHVVDTVVLPKLSLSYRAHPAAMLYFNVSEGYEPGRLTLFGDLPLIPYKPEKALNFEAGVKGQTENGFLTYEVAAFYIESTDRQLETLVVVDGVPDEAIGNVGDASTIGGEFSLAMRPTPELSFAVNGGVMNSEFTAGEFDGFDVPYAPNFTGGASVDYETDLTSSLRLSLRADVSHNAGFFWDTLNTLKQEAYTLVGARIAVGSVDDKWEFAVRADNIFDEKYHSELQPWDDEEVLARRGQPRLIVGSLTYRF